MTAATNGGGGFDVDRLLNFEKRTGVKDGEIETFITKVDAVNAAIQAMKDGKLDPSEVHVDGVPTVEEERQMAEEKRLKRLDLARREKENRERQKRDEQDKWWRGAELLYGERAQIVGTGYSLQEGGILNSGKQDSGEYNTNQASPATRFLSDEEKARRKERYSMEYSRWDTWTPKDPATLSEEKEREEEDDAKRSREFEESNPDFCAQMVDDMKTRSEARDKTESEANASRLKGNRFYKAKRWEKALAQYMTSLRASPYAVNTLANVAQTLIKLNRWTEAVDFCGRTLHVNPNCVKALSRRASAFVKLAGETNGSPACHGTDALPAASSDTTKPSAVTSISENTDVPGAQHSTIVVENIVGTAELASDDEALRGGEEGAVDGLGDSEAFRASYGGREALMVLALADLNTAVGIDPLGEDIRRQRDDLSREIEEEKAEAEVMKRAKHGSIKPYDRSSSDDGMNMTGGRAKASSAGTPQDLSQRGVVNGLHRTETALPPLDTRAPAKRQGGAVSLSSAGVQQCPQEEGEENELQQVDQLLGQALTFDRRERGSAKNKENFDEDTEVGDGIALLSHPLIRLTALLETSSTARVYLRASGGLARLTAAAVAAAAPSTNSPPKTPSTAKFQTVNHSANDSGPHSAVDEPSRNAKHAAIPTDQSFSIGGGNDGTNIESSDDQVENSVGGVGRNWRRFGFLLSAVAAALEGGERLAQQEVWRSGLLERCAWVLEDTRYAHDNDIEEVRKQSFAAQQVGPSIGELAGTAGAAALVVSRAAGDLEVRMHVARSIPLLSGLVGLIGAYWPAPLAVQSASETLRDVLLGCTAPVATKSLRSMADAASSFFAVSAPSSGEAFAERGAIPVSPVLVLGGALRHWRESFGRMQGAPASVGEALCGALANFARHEEFRRYFGENCSEISGGGRGSCGTSALSTAGVLVLVAGDRKPDRSEARSLALAALMNACLHTESTQAATFSAGGLALAVAFLSLQGEERSRNVPPLVAARSAGLLSRLAPHRPALEAMKRSGVLERIIKATVRSATLGGNIYTAEPPSEDPKAIANKSMVATSPVLLKHIATAAAIERENLVRALASILRSLSAPKLSPPDPCRRKSNTIVSAPMPAPSSNVHDNADSPVPQAPPTPSGNSCNSVSAAGNGAEGFAVVAAEREGLGGALVSFLPPAREDGLDGVTRDSVALRPVWSTPAAVTANVCGCLLHLLGHGGGDRGGCDCSGAAATRGLADQVVEAGGIPRLISLFANSGGSDALTVRKNVAICLAKLAREPRHKEVITKLRGMEMLLQSGSGLDV